MTSPLTEKNRPERTEFDRPESFQLKGALFPMNLLEVKSLDLTRIKDELSGKVSSSPDFFKHSLVVLGFDHIDDDQLAHFGLEEIKQHCDTLNLNLVALRSNNTLLASQAHALGLSVLKAKSTRRPTVEEAGLDIKPIDEPEAQLTKTAQNSGQSNSVEDSENNSQDEEASDKTVASSKVLPSKIVATPVRSGQQIYAPGADLIILSSVSAGAEILADGSIHVYGALRGRALAGVQGNEQARVFCSSHEAELISIAGHFLVDENLKAKHWKDNVQFYLQDNEINIKPLNKI